MKPSVIRQSIEDAKLKVDEFLKRYRAIEDKYGEANILLDDSHHEKVFYRIYCVKIEGDKFKFYDSDIDKEVVSDLVQSNWLTCEDDKPTKIWYTEEPESWIRYWSRQLDAYEEFKNQPPKKK